MNVNQHRSRLLYGSLVLFLAGGRGSAWADCGTLSGTPINCSGGKVGIGTASPSAPLEVQGGGSIIQQFSTGTANHLLGIGNVNDGYNRYWYFMLGSNTNDGYIFYNRQAGDTNGISLRSNGGNWYRISMFHNDVYGGLQSDGNLALQPAHGSVGIGTVNTAGYKLAVDGSIGARDIVVTATPWSDYVFQPGYQLRPLSEVSAFIQANRHLPEIPSEAEVKQKGVSVGEMQAKLLAKIEELTLHMIAEHERNNRLETENWQLHLRMERMEQRAEGKQ